MKRIGIDVGGTFTDVILIDDATGVRRILDLASSRGREIGFIGHGSTIATNMLVEGKGARTVLITTKGFRDILEIRRVSRHDRADLYDLFFANPPPLVPRRHRFEAEERILFDGSVDTALSVDEIERLVSAVERSGAE